MTPSLLGTNFLGNEDIFQKFLFRVVSCQSVDRGYFTSSPVVVGMDFKPITNTTQHKF